MLPNLSQTFEVAQAALMITAYATRGGKSSVRLCMTGEVDQAAAPLLSAAIDWLCEVEPPVVSVDLSGVTYAGSALPNFIARVHQELPEGTHISLCRVGPATDFLLRVTGMAVIAKITKEPTVWSQIFK